jgi:hypothetical protein
MRHLGHLLAVVVAAVVAVIPASLLTPAATHFLTAHPVLAVYLVAVTAFLTKLVKKLPSTLSGSSSSTDGPGGGSATMESK